jgi:hypothetical protein
MDNTFKSQNSKETSGESCKNQRMNISVVMCHERTIENKNSSIIEKKKLFRIGIIGNTK